MKNQAGDYFRLAWRKEDADRRRALPPGEYTLTNYTIARRDDKGKEWFLSATGRMIRRLTVRAGQEQQVKLDETLAMGCRARAGAGGVEIAMAIHGEHHSGLSLYREGRRIAVRYRVDSAQGRELAAGALEYG